MEWLKLSDEDWGKLEAKFRAHLNTFEQDPELQLGDDYFVDHRVYADVPLYDMYRFLLIEMIPDDEGGPSMLFIHCSSEDITDIEFAAWTFDTSTVVWIDNGWGRR